MSDLDSQATLETTNAGGIESPTTMDSTIADSWAEISKGLQEPSETVARDVTGRFVKMEPVAEKAPEVSEEKPAEVPQAAAEPEVPAAPAPEAPKAPGSWKAEAKAVFDKLDPLIQSEVLRREADFHKGIESYKAQAETAKKYEALVAPYMATIQKLGVTPDVALGALLKADHTLRNAPPAVKVQYMHQLAKEYGIDLGAEIDPNVAAMQSRIYELEQRQEQWQQEQQRQSSHAVNTEIAKFASEPGREHFEAVRDHMAALLQGGQAKDLQDAYDQAVYANPQTRAQVLAKQLEAQRAEARKKAEEAKKAAAVNIPARGVLPAAGPRGSIEDTIRAEAERLGFGHR